MDGFASELNQGGMALCAPLAIEVGDEITVEFTAFLSSATGPLTAVVRNFHGKVHGIEFAPKTAAEERMLDALRNRLCQDVAFPDLSLS